MDALRSRTAWGSAWAVIVVAFAATLLASPGTALARGSDLKGTIEGTVQDEKQRPIAAAEVTVEVTGKPTLKATSDAAGKFLLPGVPVGPVKVKVSARGYDPWSDTVVVAGKGNTRAVATLKLGVTYAGKVADERGAAIAGAWVRAWPFEMSAMPWNLMFPDAKTVRSAADGTFRLDGLSPAKRYRLHVRHPHYVAMEVGELSGRAGTVREGIEAVLRDAAWVTGVVTDPAGKPVAKARLGCGGDAPPIHAPRTAWDADMEKRIGLDAGIDASYLTDAQGRFTVGGIEGDDAEIVVDADGYFLARVKVSGLVAGKELGDQKVVLEALTTGLQGWVVDTTGHPIGLAHVDLVGDDGGEAGTGFADDGGNFRFVLVRSKGPVTVKVTADEYAPAILKNVALGRNNLKVALGQGPRIKLKVVDPAGAPVTEYEVHVTSKSTDDAGSDTQWRMKEVRKADGTTEIVVPVGEVTLQIVADGFVAGRAGPFTLKGGQVMDGGTVTLQKKGE